VLGIVLQLGILFVDVGSVLMAFFTGVDEKWLVVLHTVALL